MSGGIAGQNTLTEAIGTLRGTWHIDTKGCKLVCDLDTFSRLVHQIKTNTASIVAVGALAEPRVGGAIQRAVDGWQHIVACVACSTHSV